MTGFYFDKFENNSHLTEEVKAAGYAYIKKQNELFEKMFACFEVQYSYYHVLNHKFVGFCLNSKYGISEKSTADINLSNNLMPELEKYLKNCYFYLTENGYLSFYDIKNEIFGNIFFHSPYVFKLKLHFNSSEFDISKIDKLIYKLDQLGTAQDKSKSYFYLMLSNKEGIDFKKFPINENLTVDLGLHYGTNFNDKHEEIVSKLKNGRSGLFMFSGEPGTGKTTYIKHLSKILPEIEFIYVPVSMFSSLSSPDLLSVLLAKNFKNPVFVLEDAEKIALPREGDNNSLVAALLNLTDGILSSLLNSQFIISHNADFKDIDKALKRKGRCKMNYCFNRLSIEESNNLLKHLGNEAKTNKGLTLAEIFNYSDENYVKEERQIGFSK